MNENTITKQDLFAILETLYDLLPKQNYIDGLKLKISIDKLEEIYSILPNKKCSYLNYR